MENGIRTIAFPSISTGVCFYPIEKAANVAVHAVYEFVKNHLDAMDSIEWVFIDNTTKSYYDAKLAKIETEKTFVSVDHNRLQKR